MDKNTNPKNLKIFFIKLISICIAIIITINALFNILISERFSQIEQILSLSELENRREYGSKLREVLNDALEKDNLIKKEDRVLIYKLYQKLKAEFKDIN